MRSYYDILSIELLSLASYAFVIFVHLLKKHGVVQILKIKKRTGLLPGPRDTKTLRGGGHT